MTKFLTILATGSALALVSVAAPTTADARLPSTVLRGRSAPGVREADPGRHLRCPVCMERHPLAGFAGDRTKVIPAQAQVQRQPGLGAPVILNVNIGLPEAKVLFIVADLALNLGRGALYKVF